MAISTNTGVIVGYLGSNPEFTQRGENNFCEFRVGVNHGKKADGTERDPSFFTVKTYGKTAISCRDYLAKGKRVSVHYELRQDTWQTPEGQTRSMVYLAARQVEFLTPRNGNGDTPAPVTTSDAPPADETDDIPF